MSRILAPAILIVVLAPALSVAQGPGPGPDDRPGWSVLVETKGGDKVAGTLRLKSITIACDLGDLEIKAEKIKTIHLAASADEPLSGSREGIPVKGDIVTTSGSTIKGEVHFPQDLKMETELGSLTLSPSKLSTLTFQGPAGAAPKESKPADPASTKKEGEGTKPEAADRSTKPSPIPRYLLQPSSTRVSRLSAGPARPNPRPHTPIRYGASSSGPMKRRVMKP